MEPRLAPWERTSYVILTPVESYREIGCKAAGCLHYEQGWQTVIDERTELGQRQGGYIRHRSGRHFHEELLADGRSQFIFASEQRCFRIHKQVVRSQFHVKREGDSRQWTGDSKRMSGQTWLDDFGEHQEKLADAVRRG